MTAKSRQHAAAIAAAIDAADLTVDVTVARELAPLPTLDDLGDGCRVSVFPAARSKAIDARIGADDETVTLVAVQKKIDPDDNDTTDPLFDTVEEIAAIFLPDDAEIPTFLAGTAICTAAVIDPVFDPEKARALEFFSIIRLTMKVVE